MKWVGWGLFFISIAAAGVEPTFRMTAGGCTRNGVPGLNPGRLGECGDVNHKHLTGEERGGADLRGLKFVSAKLKRVEFSDAVLDFSDGRMAVAQGSRFSSARFEYSDLRGAVFYRSDFVSSDFGNSDLRGTKFVRSNLRSSRFSGAKLHGAEFFDSDLEGADLTGADLRDVVLVSSSLKGARFDCETLLPFGRATAWALGMISREGRAPCP